MLCGHQGYLDDNCSIVQGKSSVQMYRRLNVLDYLELLVLQPGYQPVTLQHCERRPLVQMLATQTAGLPVPAVQVTYIGCLGHFHRCSTPVSSSDFVQTKGAFARKRSKCSDNGKACQAMAVHEGLIVNMPAKGTWVGKVFTHDRLLLQAACSTAGF